MKDDDGYPLIEATAAHLPFLREMLFEAAYWRPGVHRPPLDLALQRPELRKLLAGWGTRPGDAGVIALGPADEFVGASWYRFWTDADHSYGYVSADIPELAIAVAADRRGQGAGKALMTGLLLTASRAGLERISLSVEQDNPAASLYRRFGFREVSTVGNAWTMVAEVPATPT